MTKIKLNWAYAKGELDTDTLKLYLPTSTRQTLIWCG
nr:MAG TPA: hypothetical protein [Caudoviricetes sp.]